MANWATAKNFGPMGRNNGFSHYGFRGRCDDALSIWFLLFWLLGDGCNLTGCLLTHQFPIQTMTAIYYVAMDIAIIVQEWMKKIKVLFYKNFSSSHEIIGNRHFWLETNLSFMCRLPMSDFYFWALVKELFFNLHSS